jgi:hypothetical protein
MKRALWLAAIIALPACGGGKAAPSAAPVAAPAPTASAAPGDQPGKPVERPLAQASSAPTVLSAEDRKRDAAREPLATSTVDAYPNWGGLFSSLIATWSPDGKHIVFGSLRDGLPEIALLTRTARFLEDALK